jgi:hypothetical protein
MGFVLCGLFKRWITLFCYIRLSRANRHHEENQPSEGRQRCNLGQVIAWLCSLSGTCSIFFDKEMLCWIRSVGPQFCCSPKTSMGHDRQWAFRRQPSLRPFVRRSSWPRRGSSLPRIATANGNLSVKKFLNVTRIVVRSCGCYLRPKMRRQYASLLIGLNP